MSREYISVAPGQARTRRSRGPASSGGRGRGVVISSTAGNDAPSDGARTSASPAGTKALALFSLAAVALLAITILLRAGAMQVNAVGPWAGDASGSRRVTTPATQAIDPRLILTPRTVTQAATASGVRLQLAAGPVLPGPNRFDLRLAAHGRPLTRSRVVLAARMIGMAMRPVTLPMRELQPGRYAATGPLAMFGRWQITVRIERPGMTLLSRQFTVGVDLPRGLLTAPATRGVSQQ